MRLLSDFDFDPLCNATLYVVNQHGVQSPDGLSCTPCMTPQPPREQWYLTAGSFTFTAPIDGTYTFKGRGPGGGGGGGSGSNGSADGGAEGGYFEKTFALLAGQSVAIVVGAGGSGGGTNLYGSTGAATTVTYAPLSIACTANSGAGGARAQDSPLNAAGGTASGGDVNTTGAVGGAAPTSANGGNGGGTSGGAGGINNTTAPTAGTLGGGGGGGAQGGTGQRSGAAGGAGWVHVTW